MTVDCNSVALSMTTDRFTPFLLSQSPPLPHLWWTPSEVSSSAATHCNLCWWCMSFQSAVAHLHCISHCVGSGNNVGVLLPPVCMHYINIHSVLVWHRSTMLAKGSGGMHMLGYVLCTVQYSAMCSMLTTPVHVREVV